LKYFKIVVVGLKNVQNEAKSENEAKSTWVFQMERTNCSDDEI